MTDIDRELKEQPRERPATGQDWCPNGCQPLYELGECGMCGYIGDGVHEDELHTIVDACKDTGRYARQTTDGFCYGCGKRHGDRENSDPPR